MSKQNKPLLLNDLEARIQIPDEDDVPLQSSCTIYKVPWQLRRVNQLAHTPSVVSIGPYHYGDSRLESMQEFKFWYFKKFLKRVINKEDPLKVLFEAIRKKEVEIRGCYSENIKMSSDEFVRLITVDASFIIEFLCATCDSKSEGITSYLMLDLVLLENQIPFFVLEILFRLATFPDVENEIKSFVQLAIGSYFLKHIYPSDKQKVLARNERQPSHFCGLLRNLYGSSSFFPMFEKGTKYSYGVSQLKDAGFKFEVDDDDSKRITDLECLKERSALKIPPMKITNWTEILLRNVVAFEQCHYPFERSVTDYIILLDCLINTEKDVEILVEKGIMHTLVDNDKVADMVNNLRNNLSATHISLRYVDVYQMFSKLHDNTYYKNKATFVPEYWSTPWKKLSLLGGIMLLFLTLIQTICSIISLIKQ